MVGKALGKGLGGGHSPRQSAESSQDVTFWGVRGTIPTPGESTLKYGGSTSCVEVVTTSGHERTSVILDAGTGITKHGEYALKRGDREFHIFLSHMHYDHIFGLTRFAPLFRDDCRISFYGQSKCGKSLQEILQSFFSYPFFPVRFEDLGSRRNLHFTEINNLQELSIGCARIQFQSLHHPQDAVAFRVSNKNEPKGTSVVYATDHEHGTSTDDRLETFCKDASLLIYDSTYNENNYNKFKGWGHSTAFHGASIAKAANVDAYAIFHHDPDSSDEALESAILPEAQEHFQRSFLAIEGFALPLNKLANSRQSIESLLKRVQTSDDTPAQKRRLTRS